jgi:RNA-directed DNA polymerase
MLFIRKINHLAERLAVSPANLERLVDSPEQFIDELLVCDPRRPNKPRKVLDVHGSLRRAQRILHREILRRKLKPTSHSYGSVRGRDIKANALAHARSRFVFKTDISNFYPSVHHSRVYRLFAGEFGCSPDVARFCTRMTTFRHHLALGLITSPILADRLLLTIDQRIGAACRNANLRYTRYVDDITISGAFDLHRSGFTSLVEGVLEEHGFQVNRQKHEYGNLNDDSIAITGVRIVDGRLDVQRDYAEELERQLADAASLALGGDFQGPYYTRDQIHGRIRFVCWISPQRKSRLLRKFRSINWDAASIEAQRKGLVASRRTVTRIVEASVAGVIAR